MTIPTRPAPLPPGSRGQNAAAGANASIEQLRLQLQQQQQQQQQLGGIQKITIKLPPPPKRPTSSTITAYHNSKNNNNNNNNNNINHSSGSSITRKFPQARYTPTTGWDDSPFDLLSSGGLPVATSKAKKIPPPRPPPPKVQATTGANPPPAKGGYHHKQHNHHHHHQSTNNILSNIFHRKKSHSSAGRSHSAASRIYGVSSGNNQATAAAAAPSNRTSTSTANTDWNAAWNATTTSTSTATVSSTIATTTTTGLGIVNSSSGNSWHSSGSMGLNQEPQLISFDSPPSSPTFTQKSNSDCVSVDSFSSDSNFSSPNNGSVSQPESGFEDDFHAGRSRPATTSPLDPWETVEPFGNDHYQTTSVLTIGTAPVRNLTSVNGRASSSNDNPLCNGKSLLPPAPSLNTPTIIKPKISQKPKAPKPPALVAMSGEFDDDLVTPPSPPMPKCAPPPPPPSTGVTLLDVISGKVDAIHLSGGAVGGGRGVQSEESGSQPYGIALYNFDGVEEGDLSFRENEKIYLLEQLTDEWYRGRTRSGCEGIFPANYIEIKVPLDATNSSPASDAPQGTSTSQRMRIRCLYNFQAEVEGDLPLMEDDIVTVLYRINEDWLYGEIAGKQGQFPANFLEYVPDNLPLH